MQNYYEGAKNCTSPFPLSSIFILAIDFLTFPQQKSPHFVVFSPTL